MQAGFPLSSPPPAPLTGPGAAGPAVCRGLFLSPPQRAPVTCVLARRQPRDGLHVRGERRGGGQRHEPRVPRGRAVHLRLQPRRAPQGPAAGLAVGRLRRQHRLRLPLREGVRGRARARAHPRQGLIRERAHPHEPAQQRGWPQGECPSRVPIPGSRSLNHAGPLPVSLPLPLPPLPSIVSFLLFSLYLSAPSRSPSLSVFTPLSIFSGLFPTLPVCLSLCLSLFYFLPPPPQHRTQPLGRGSHTPERLPRGESSCLGPLQPRRSCSCPRKIFLCLFN